MKEFLKKYKIWVNAAVLPAIILLLVFFIVLPLKRSIQRYSDDIQERIIDNKMNQERVAKIPEMEKIEVAFAENSSDLNVTMGSDNEVDFIKKVEALAEETGNKIDLKIQEEEKNKKTPSDKKDPNDIKGNLPYSKYLSIQMSLEGDYGKTLNFIHKLENMSYYVNVISFSMAKGAENKTSSGPTANNMFTANSSDAKSEPAIVFKSVLQAVVYLDN